MDCFSLPSLPRPLPSFPVVGANFSTSLTPGLVMRVALRPEMGTEVSVLGVQATALRGIRWIAPPAPTLSRDISDGPAPSSWASK